MTSSKLLLGLSAHKSNIHLVSHTDPVDHVHSKPCQWEYTIVIDNQDAIDVEGRLKLTTILAGFADS